MIAVREVQSTTDNGVIRVELTAGPEGARTAQRLVITRADAAHLAELLDDLLDR